MTVTLGDPICTGGGQAMDAGQKKDLRARDKKLPKEARIYNFKKEKEEERKHRKIRKIGTPSEQRGGKTASCCKSQAEERKYMKRKALS